MIVETIRGIEFGTVVIGKKELPEEELVLPLKPVIRKATPEDIKVHQSNKAKEKEALEICKQKLVPQSHQNIRYMRPPDVLPEVRIGII